MVPSFNGTTRSLVPFPHLRVAEILCRDDADHVLAWLREEAPWKLTIAEFYEQYEFSLLHSSLAPRVRRLIETDFIEAVRVGLERFLWH